MATINKEDTDDNGQESKDEEVRTESCKGCRELFAILTCVAQTSPRWRDPRNAAIDVLNLGVM